MDFSLLPKLPQAGWFTKFLVKIAGADLETLLQCPQSDWANVRAVAEIMLLTWCYQSALLSGIAHRIFAGAGRFHPEYVLGAMFIATFILLIDSYMVMRSGWHLSGISELKRGGIDLGGGILARVKVGVFFTFRILLSVGIAQLTAIFFGLIVFADDVETRMGGNVVISNGPIIAAVTARVDDDIARAREAAAAQAPVLATVAANLNALRQKEIDPPTTDPDIRQAESELADLRKQKSKADEDLLAAQSFATDELAGIKNAPGNSGQIGEGVRYRAATEHVANAKAHVAELVKALEAAQARVDALRSHSSSASETLRRQTHDQVVALESTLATERNRQAALDARLAELLRNRDATIKSAVESAPNYARRHDGMLAQVSALRQIAGDDPTIGLLILLIDLVSFGFELAAVLAKVTSFVPTTYAALLARDAYMQSVRIVDDMMTQLEQRKSADDGEADDEFDDVLPSPANDNEDDTSVAPPTAPVEPDEIAPPPSTAPKNPEDLPPPPAPTTTPKRGRGRPRKSDTPPA